MNDFTHSTPARIQRSQRHVQLLKTAAENHSEEPAERSECTAPLRPALQFEIRSLFVEVADAGETSAGSNPGPRSWFMASSPRVPPLRRTCDAEDASPLKKSRPIPEGSPIGPDSHNVRDRSISAGPPHPLLCCEVGKRAASSIAPHHLWIVRREDCSKSRTSPLRSSGSSE